MTAEREGPVAITTIQDEGKALKEIWDSLTGLSIALVIENKYSEECHVVASKQSAGTRKGSWDSIPAGKVEECGTQHDGFAGAHNTGGVIYAMGTSGNYLGIVWDDPSFGKAEYGWAYGTPNFVEPKIESWWDGFDGTPIGGAKSKWVVAAGMTKVLLQPGFDPFKIDIVPMVPGAEGLPAQADSGATPRANAPVAAQEMGTRLLQADRQEALAKALLASAERLRSGD